MSSHCLVDPEILPLLELLPPLDLSDATLPEIRERLATPAPDLPPCPLEPRAVAVAGLHGAPDVPVLVFDPPGRSARAAILHIHGGGMVLGSAASSNLANAALALALGAPVVSVDYRLAPDNPFPAPQEDCLAAFDWLVASAGALGIDPARIAVRRERRGGLAAALAQMIRDTGRQAPCGQVLTYPMLDHRVGGEGHPALGLTGEFVWTAQANQYGWRALRGAYAANDRRAGWFSPALANDLTNLPPAWIGVGALDLFLGENLDYAKRLVAAGVPVDVDVYAGCVHAFNAMPGARASEAYARDVREAFTRFLRL